MLRTDSASTDRSFRERSIWSFGHNAQRWHAIVSARARQDYLVYIDKSGVFDRSENYTPVMVKTQSATISDLTKRWTLVQVPLGACIAARGGSICCVLCGIVQPGLSTFYVDFHRCNDPWTGGSRRFNAHPRRGWSGDWTGQQILPRALAWWSQVIFRKVTQNGLISYVFWVTDIQECG